MNQQSSDPRDAMDSQTSPPVPALIESSSMSLVLKAEIDSQITTARQFPRNMKRAIANITELATMDEETAAECLYALVRKKKTKARNQAADAEENKPIEGPSIRLAEIAVQCWGNNRAEAHVVEIDRKEKVVIARGAFHDLETNVVQTATVRRRIAYSSGGIFNDDMINVTGNAACAIAKRNAILAGIPRAIYRQAYTKAREMVAGNIASLPANREKAMKAFASFGVKPEQILEVLDLERETDIRVEHIATLRGMFTALKNGEATVEEMFAKEKPNEADPDRNPLVRGAGAGTNDSISTGGQQHEVTDSNDKGGPEADGPSLSNDRSAAAQQDSQAGAAPANETSQQASAPPAPADAGASPSAPQDSPQPDLLSRATTRDSSGQPPARQAEGADVSRGETASAPTLHPATPERLRSYSKALATIENGGPTKLGKQSNAWVARNGDFDAAGSKVAGKILAVHTQRITGEINMEACLKQIEGIIG